MATTDPEFAELKTKRRWSRFSWRQWLVLTLLVVVSGTSLAVWSLGLPLSWTADYDRESYTRIRRAIDADEKHLLGRSFAEVSKELGLNDVPWDDAAFQQPQGMFRIYHFRGFAFYVTLELLPAGITPNTKRPWNSTEEDPQRSGVLWLAHQYPFVRIDGIADRKERMRRYWKVIDEECARINAEMDRRNKEKSQ